MPQVGNYGIFGSILRTERGNVCQDAYGRTLMLNGTWTMDPLQAGGWNNAASVRINKDSYSYSRRSAVPEEPFPPINPHAIVQAPAEDEDVITRSLLPLPKSAGFQNKCSIVVEEHDSHHKRTQKGSPCGLAGKDMCLYPRDLGSRPG